MRKLAAVLTATVILFTITACTDTETERIVERSESEAHAEYVNAVNKVRAADSFEGHIIVSGQFAMMDVARENAATIGVKHIFDSDGDLLAEIDATSAESNFKAYYKDGVFYLDDYDYSDNYDDSFKFAMQGQDFLNMTLSMLVTEVLFSEEDIFGLEVIEDAYGTAIRFEVRQTGMQDVLRQLASYEDTGGTSIHDEEATGYEFQDVVIMVRIDKNGALKDIKLAFLYSMVHHHVSDDTEISAYLEIGMSISQLGGVTIDYPDDMLSFPDLGEMWG